MKIEKQISSSNFGLYDITSWNANVALELGMAYGLNKERYILFNPKFQDNQVPSDLQGFDRIEYKSMTELEAQITVLIQRKVTSFSKSVSSEYDSIKEHITKYIYDNPGCGLSKISHDTKFPKSVVQGTIKNLLDINKIRPEGKKKGTKYFPP